MEMGKILQGVCSKMVFGAKYIVKDFLFPFTFLGSSFPSLSKFKSDDPESSPASSDYGFARLGTFGAGKTGRLRLPSLSKLKSDDPESSPEPALWFGC